MRISDWSSDVCSSDLIAVQADVTDPVAVAAMVAAAHTRFAAPITTVVNNALPTFSFNGDARPHADALAWEDLHQQFEGIVRGALNTTQAALPGMREQRSEERRVGTGGVRTCRSGW